MTPLDAFTASLATPAPPSGLTEVAQALWWDAKGDWARAHQHAQAQDNPAGNAIHAYLHRKEGDLPNARYWYARAGRPMPAGTLAEEWAALVRELL